MIDLHTHSVFSDGFFTPTELLKKAYNKGVRILALTDHDTFGGIGEFLEAGKNYGDLKTIIGCEVSSRFNDDYDVHVLALNVKDMDRISKYASPTNEIRREKIKQSIKLLQKHGYNINYEDDIANRQCGTLTDRNIVDAFIKKGLAVEKEEVKALIGKGGIAYYPIYSQFPNILDTIEVINSAGAISVLAHPHRLKFNDEDLTSYVKNLVDKGLQGIECYHSGSTLEESDFYCKLAKKFNLIVTGGSDHHGKPDEIYKDFGMSNSLQRKIPKDIADYFLNNVCGK